MRCRRATRASTGRRLWLRAVVAAGGARSGMRRQRRYQRQATADEPIKIGASLPLTGEFSEPGKAAQQGYEVWADDGQRAGRPARPQGRDRHQGRRERPEHGRRRLQRADQPRQGRPAARHVLLAAQPAGVGGRRAQPDALRRARRRAPGHLQRGFKYLFFAQQATADHQGDVWATTSSACRRQTPEDGRLPDARRPVRDAGLDGDRGEPRGGRDQDRLRRDLHADTTNFDAIANAVKAPNPTSSSHGATFEDGVGFMRALDKVGFTPKLLLPDQRAVVRRPVLEGRRRSRTPRASSTRSATARGRDARQRRVRRDVQRDVRRRCRPRTRPTRSPRRR